MADPWVSSDLLDPGIRPKEDHELGWQPDGSPTLALLANAIQCWSILQRRETTIGEAALAFNMTPEKIAEAVDWHVWMFIDPPNGPPRHAPLVELVIGHEGE